jgi:hypothetical protein
LDVTNIGFTPKRAATLAPAAAARVPGGVNARCSISKTEGNNMLKTYMGFSRGAGPEEGAILIFAHSVKEARKVGWNMMGCELTDEYIDFAATIIRKSPWLREEANALKLANDEAHVIDDPRSCDECGMWGIYQIGEDGLCEECRDDQLELELEKAGL